MIVGQHREKTSEALYPRYNVKIVTFLSRGSSRRGHNRATVEDKRGNLVGRVLQILWDKIMHLDKLKRQNLGYNLGGNRRATRAQNKRLI